MDKKKHADGEDQHEWADEKPQVQVKISNEPIESTAHIGLFLIVFATAEGMRQIRSSLRWDLAHQVLLGDDEANRLLSSFPLP